MGIIDELDFSGESTKVQISGMYHKGKFHYTEDLKEIELEENSEVIIKAYLTDLPKKDHKRFRLERKVVLPKNSYVVFELPKTGLKFHVLLLEDLRFRKINNKLAVAEDCRCRVTHATEFPSRLIPEEPDFEPIEVESLNQAFFRVSLLFRPNARSHTTNIYKSFKIKDNFDLTPLESLRF
jgi:hypothetical protein